MGHNKMPDTKSIELWSFGCFLRNSLEKSLSFKCHFQDKSMCGNAQNVPERSTFRYMCLRDNLTDRAYCTIGRVQSSKRSSDEIQTLFLFEASPNGR